MGTEFTQARIRVSQEGALAVRQALFLYRHKLLQERKLLTGAQRDAYNEALRVVRRVHDEVIRTIDEQGWDDDQSVERDESQTGS